MIRFSFSQKLQTFAVLCEQYEQSIKRDPCYLQYLDKIGQIFFGLKPPQQPKGGFLGNFFENFLSGLDEDSDEDTPPQASCSNSKPSSSKPLIENTEMD